MGRPGFSLIELMVGVAIAAILALVAGPRYVEAVDQARNASLRADVRAVQAALEAHAADHHGAYPQTLVEPALLAYLPGKALPRTPWYAKPQAVAVQFNGPGHDFNDAQWGDLVEMAARRSFSYGSLGGPSGRMGDVAGAPSEVDHIGLLRMNVDPAARTYRLFAQGKRDQYRIIVAPVSNEGR